MTEIKETVPSFIFKISEPSELRQVMKNAKRQKRDDVYWVAFNQLCKLEGKNQEDPLHSDFYEILAAYEALLTEKNGRTTKATRTRQKLARHNIEKCLEDWAISDTPTQGFLLLVDKGLYKLTAEFLVIKYKDRFSHNIVEAAHHRLQEAGLDIDLMTYN
jgi:hypothetical protein